MASPQGWMLQGCEAVWVVRGEPGKRRLEKETGSKHGEANQLLAGSSELKRRRYLRNPLFVKKKKKS